MRRFVAIVKSRLHASPCGFGCDCTCTQPAQAAVFLLIAFDCSLQCVKVFQTRAASFGRGGVVDRLYRVTVCCWVLCVFMTDRVS
jgi:hypothetical protein